MRLRHVWVIPLLLFTTVNSAWAYFDIVGLYHQKVKDFEAVYFLTEDKTWGRDRRIFEFFGNGDKILAPMDDDGNTVGSDLWNLSGGLLFNIRPNKGKVQLTFFNLYSGNETETSASSGPDATEWLHGARLTMGDYAEVTLGGYWKTESMLTAGADGKTKDASGFLELTCPAIWLKSSYVIGLSEKLGRFDLRWEPDEFTFFDHISVGPVYYGYDKEKWMFAADVVRLGFPKFRFFTFQSRWTTDGPIMMKTGLDLRIQFQEDFNLTRRGHFGTSIGLQAFYTRGNPAKSTVFDVRQSGPAGMGGLGGYDLPDKMLTGYQLKFILQAPAKWILAILQGMAAAYSGDRRMMEQFGRSLQNIAREPRDIMFGRLEFEYTYNSPDTFLYPVDVIDRHRLFMSVGFVY